MTTTSALTNQTELTTLEQSLTRLGLENWTPSMELPKAATARRLTEAQNALESKMMPASPQDRAVAIKRLLDFGRAFNIKINDPQQLAATYNLYLNKLPADLLERSVTLILGCWKWGNRLPTPAEVAEMVNSEMTNRVIMAGKISMALRRIPPPAKEKIESAELDALMRDCRNRFKSKRQKTIEMRGQ